MERVTRRDFVVGAAATGVIGACAARIAYASTGEQTTRVSDPAIAWADAADVVVVGGGGSGFAAAVEAAKAGASVLVLEKGDLCGGDTLRSGGMMMVGGSDLQAKLGIGDSAERFVENELAYGGEYVDRDMVAEMCLSSVDELEFMEGLGRIYDAVISMAPAWEYDVDGVWAPRTHMVSSTGSATASDEERAGHFGALEKAALELGVKALTGAEVAHLVKKSDEGVIGVQTADGRFYRANRGVVIATASFGQNVEMSRRYNQMNYWALRFQEEYDEPSPNMQCSTNTGDGIRMAQEIGADLMCAPSNCISSIPTINGNVNGLILVNRHGKRFAQENAHWAYLNQIVFNECVRTGALEPQAGTVWAIADQTTVDENRYLSGALSGWGVTEKAFYADLIVKADTLEELADACGLPSDALLETVERWNGMVDAGFDVDFLRQNYNGSQDMEKVETGPFYGFPYIPYCMGSFGGLRTDIGTRVIDVQGRAIPRLFAAGAVMSGMYTAPFYNSCGWSVLGTVHWGRKAGIGAAALDAWTDEEVTAVDEAASDVQAAVDQASGSYTAGVYSATAHGRNGDFEVSVEFGDTAIVAVTVGDNEETGGIGSVAVEKMPERILLAQSAEADAVSGATVTSQAIMAAVQECIDKATR